MPIPAGYTQLTTGFWRKDSDLSGPYAWTGAAFYLISTGVAGSGVPADYTQHPSGFWFKTADGSGPYSYDGTNFWLAGNGGPSGAITVATVNVTSAINMANGSTFNLYNTADQTTNYERLRADWSGNIARLYVQSAGTGADRDFRVGTATLYHTYQQRTAASPFVSFVYTSTTSTNSTGINQLSSGTVAASSGTQTPVSIAPTINQSGTAGYTALDINPTETATGSGTKLLLRAAVANSERFRVDNLGIAYAPSFISVTSTGIGWASGFGAVSDLRLVRDNPSELALRYGSSAQTFRGYEAYTDGSNYSRWYQTFSGGFAYYGTQAAGTGTRRPLIVQHFTTTLAALPTAATAGAGSRAVISDATAPVFGAAVVGGGAVVSPVYSDGANWIVG